MTELMPFTNVILLTILTGLMGAIVYRDVTRFEIDIAAIITASAGVLALNTAAGFNPLSHVLAGAVMLIVAALVHRMFHKGFGLGDYYLYGFMGLTSGLNLLLFMVSANVVFGALTAAWYSKLRGKKPLRSLFPAALPGMAASAICIILQMMGADVVQKFSFGMGTIENLIGAVVIPQGVMSVMTAVAIVSGCFILIERALAMYCEHTDGGSLTLDIRKSVILTGVAILIIVGVIHAQAQSAGGTSSTPEQSQITRSTSTAEQTQIAGVASVIDGDTIEIQGNRIRLTGIDAPESAQTCQKKDGTEWPCGQDISDKLARLINKRQIQCHIEGVDKYGRHLGTCFYKRININAAIVRAGWAMAYRRYSTRYVPHETKAKARERGIWAGPFMPPWQFRAGVQ